MRVAGLSLELLRVVEQLSVPVVEVWVLAAATLDGAVRERGLGVVDVVDQGNLAAGEVGVLAADRDAGVASDVRPVRGGEQLRSAALDRARQVAYSLVMRCRRAGESGRVPVLDATEKLVEFGGKVGVVRQRGAVAAASAELRLTRLPRRSCSRESGGDPVESASQHRCTPGWAHTCLLP